MKCLGKSIGMILSKHRIRVVSLHSFPVPVVKAVRLYLFRVYNEPVDFIREAVNIHIVRVVFEACVILIPRLVGHGNDSGNNTRCLIKFLH